MPDSPSLSTSPSLEPRVTGRMEIDDGSYRPGDKVTVRWPSEELRGIAYSLDSWTGNGWKVDYYISAVSPGYRPQHDPTWWDADENGYGWVDIGIIGRGPDIAIIPDTADPDTYRLCTANASRKSCALLTVE